MYSYEGLLAQLDKTGHKKTDLTTELGLSSRTVAKIAKGEKLSARVMEKVADFLGAPAASLCREESDNALLQALRDEKEAGISGGIYHELQVRMTYNSNHMEGSTLTEAQTRMIFETNTVDAGDGVPVDDILETVHHFRAIDYVIDHAEAPLTEDLIKALHAILKRDTKDSTLPWFAVGEYKKRVNFVGGKKTASPDEVAGKMAALLAEYEELQDVRFRDIVAFHCAFERIHPFQDGNGRVGRLVALKECLRWNIVPFIIEDAKKAFYHRGLAKWDEEPGYLLDTCLDGQDTVRRFLADFAVL